MATFNETAAVLIAAVFRFVTATRDITNHGRRMTFSEILLC